jgi:hypothetical protein
VEKGLRFTYAQMAVLNTGITGTMKTVQIITLTVATLARAYQIQIRKFTFVITLVFLRQFFN